MRLSKAALFQNGPWSATAADARLNSDSIIGPVCTHACMEIHTWKTTNLNI